MYDPTRILIMDSVLGIIHACEECNLPDRRIFVPLVPEILQILDNPAFAKKPKAIGNKNNKDKNNDNSNSNNNNNNNNNNDNDNNNDDDKDKNKNKNNSTKDQTIDLRIELKIPNGYFNTMALHSALIQNCSRLLFLYYSHYSYSIAFPELSLPSQSFLQEFLANPSISNSLKKVPRLLLKALKDNTNWINNKRKTVDFSPKDAQKVNNRTKNPKTKKNDNANHKSKKKSFDKKAKPQTRNNKPLAETQNSNNGNNNKANSKKNKTNSKKGKTNPNEDKPHVSEDIVEILNPADL
ncbi:hypothetical protein RFI_19823 [Reticulomyxa filosa]|uniref:Uncharacterized protein n=1 Tax=Reticulomyxa filosa TaxID=46433 RepID=X6MWN5_RETFI|nr:hypothetical protein RFI_19823 [Reticulomyxa filosa]|eukprot:ETO17500.1 hypothetical protein RFI_19823 [Reticulomyxa filosa]